MKIVSVMTTSGLGGAEFAAVEILDGLVARGHEAVILSNEPRLRRDTRVSVKSLHVGPKLATGTWPGLLVAWLPYLGRLWSALRSEWPYDVLLVHYKKEQLMACWLPKRLRATLAWAEWGPVPFPLRRGVPRRIYVAAARRAATVMAVSPGTKASLVSVGVPPEKIAYVPNAMRTDEIRFSFEGRARVRDRLEIAQDAFVVGCVSRFHHKKRNDVVIDAVARLSADTHLILAGEGDTEAQLRERARPLGERAHLMSTPGSEVADVVSAFDVLVFCPSPTEGAPRAVILGMLVERPCVSTGAQGVADIITEGVGAIIEPENDPEALAASLQRYVEHPERLAAEGAEARRRAIARYDLPVVAEQVEKLLADAAGPARERSPGACARPA